MVQCEHLFAQLPRGSEAREHACHNASGVRVLGLPERISAANPTGIATGGGRAEAAAAAEDGDASGAGGAAAGRAGGGDGGPRTWAVPPEVYDDSSFYHSLIKELLDDGSGAGAAAASVGSAVKLRRVKRPTDNRMSKGRKLSYEVQPKLQNFMFPEIPDRPIVLAELFASVFGQRTGSGGNGAGMANGHGTTGALGKAAAAAAAASDAAQQRAIAARGATAAAGEGELSVPVGSLFG